MVISVFLLDDHEVVRRGIVQLLDTEPDITVVGEAATAARRRRGSPSCVQMWPFPTCGCPTDTV